MIASSLKHFRAARAEVVGPERPRVFRQLFRHLHQTVRALDLRSTLEEEGFSRTFIDEHLAQLKRCVLLYPKASEALRDPDVVLSLSAYMRATAPTEKQSDSESMQGPLTRSFQKEVRSAWDSVPLSFRRMLEIDGYGFYTAPTITAYMLSKDSRYYPGDLSQNFMQTCDEDLGLFFPDLNFSVIPEFHRNEGAAPSPVGQKPSAQDILEKRWSVSPKAGATVLHETGHAIDEIIYRYIGFDASACSAFKECFEHDLLSVAYHDSESIYFRMDREVAQFELFADLAAITIGNFSKEACRSVSWKNSLAWTQNFLSGFCSAENQGISPLMLFMKKECLGQDPAPNSFYESWLDLMRRSPRTTTDDVKTWIHGTGQQQSLRNLMLLKTKTETKLNDDFITRVYINEKRRIESPRINTYARALFPVCATS